MTQYQEDLAQAYRAVKALILRDWPDHPPLTDADIVSDETFYDYLDRHDEHRRDEFQKMLSDWIVRNLGAYDKAGNRCR